MEELIEWGRINNNERIKETFRELKKRSENMEVKIYKVWRMKKKIEKVGGFSMEKGNSGIKEW